MARKRPDAGDDPEGRTLRPAGRVRYGHAQYKDVAEAMKHRERGMERRMGNGEWGMGKRSYSLLPTPHSPLPTLLSTLPTPHCPLPTTHYQFYGDNSCE